MNKGWVFAGLLVPGLLWAADQDDFYLSVQAGVELHRERAVLAGGSVGYCPWNEWGLGFVADRHFATVDEDPNLYATKMALELRWFLEPYELAAELGSLRSTPRSGATRSQPVVSVSGAYLWALTPSLAARVQVQAQLPRSAQARFFTSVGARLLF